MLVMDEHTTFTLGVAAACVAGTVAVMKLMGGGSSTPSAAPASAPRVEDASVYTSTDFRAIFSRSKA